MKNIKFSLLIASFALIIAFAFPLNVAATPFPQYNSTDDTAGRTYTGYFIEDGKLKNTLIVIKLRRLRSYWDGVAWVNCTSKVEKNNISKNLKDNDSEEIKFLAKFPSYVTIENKQVYFDPQESR